MQSGNSPEGIRIFLCSFCCWGGMRGLFFFVVLFFTPLANSFTSQSRRSDFVSRDCLIGLFAVYVIPVCSVSLLSYGFAVTWTSKVVRTYRFHSAPNCVHDV